MIGVYLFQNHTGINKDSSKDAQQLLLSEHFESYSLGFYEPFSLLPLYLFYSCGSSVEVPSLRKYVQT